MTLSSVLDHINNSYLLSGDRIKIILSSYFLANLLAWIFRIISTCYRAWTTRWISPNFRGTPSSSIISYWKWEMKVKFTEFLFLLDLWNLFCLWLLLVKHFLRWTHDFNWLVLILIINFKMQSDHKRKTNILVLGLEGVGKSLLIKRLKSKA